MKSKINKKSKRRYRFAITVISLILLSGFIFLATALTSEERSSLENELFGLESELTSSGYSWLVDYSVDYPSVEVYEYNSTEKIADFGEISSEGWYKIYLTSLDGEQDVFDLLVKGGGVEFDYIVDPTYEYNYSTGNLKAYDMGGASLPSSPYDGSLTEANSSEYTQINVSDDSRWMTAAATSDSEFDSQVFIFNMSDEISVAGEVSKLNLTWEGYGETEAGYYTNISFWNWTAGAWVDVEDNDFTSAADGTLNAVVSSGVSDFVNSTSKEVAVLVTSRKYVEAAGQCGNGELEGDEVCDSDWTLGCVNNPAYDSINYVEDGVTCNGMYACNIDCTACISQADCEGCFIAGTKITMADGTKKNIEDVKIGDIVLSMNMRTMQTEPRKVSEVMSPIHDDMINLIFEHSKNKNTFDHPYYVRDKGWASYRPNLTIERYNLETEQLNAGDVVYFLDPSGELLDSKLLEIEEEIGEVQTYNLHVESSNQNGSGDCDSNNYFANGILVHNKRCAYLFSITDEEEHFEDLVLGVFEDPGNVSSRQIGDRIFQENEGYSYLNLDVHTNKFRLIIPPHEIDYIDYVYLKVIDTLDEKFSSSGLPSEKIYNLNLVSSSEGFELMVGPDGKYFLLDGERRYPHNITMIFEELPEKDDRYHRIVQFVEKGYEEPFIGSRRWHDFAPFNQTKWREWLDTDDNDKRLNLMVNNLFYEHYRINGNHSDLFEEKMADVLLSYSYQESPQGENSLSPPFLYTYQNGEYTKLSDFIAGATSKEKEYTSYTDITNKVEVVEEEDESISLVVMSEENENDSLILLVDSEFKNKTLHNVDTSFSNEGILQGFIVTGVEDNFVDFVINNLFKDEVFSSGFVNLLFTGDSECEFITHFDESNSSKNSSAELYTLPVGSLNALFNSSICSGLGGSSSTGCQSIFSQNSQSSSVTSPVCLYLSNISCLINLINTLPSNLEPILVLSSSGNEIVNSAILLINKEGITYLNVSELEYKKISDFVAGATSKEKEYTSFIDITYNKNKKGSNRMVEPNQLTPDYENDNNAKYLNVSVSLDDGARVAEWLLQSVNTRCPSGFAGSIPVPGAASKEKEYTSFVDITDKIEVVEEEEVDTKYMNLSLNEKIKKAGRVEFSQPHNFLPQVNIFRYSKYLNILVDSMDSARMAEWLMRSPQERLPSTRSEGSNPSPGAHDSEKYYEKDITDNSKIKTNKVKLKITEELDETTYLDRYSVVVYDYPAERNGEFALWIEENFEEVNNYNLKEKPLAILPDYVDEVVVNEIGQDELTLNSDNEYLVMEEGFEKELEFDVPKMEEGFERKMFFVAEGYYIEHYKNKVEEPHRSLYTDFISLEVEGNVPPSVTFQGDTPIDGFNQSADSIVVNLSTSDISEHYSFVDFDNDLVLWMRMDDITGSGNPWDKSSYSNNGTAVGNAAQTDAGYFGDGFAFDGNGDYVTFGDLSQFEFKQDEDFSISIWAKRLGASTVTYPGLITKGSVTNRLGWCLRLGETDDVYFQIGNSSRVGPRCTNVFVNLDEWHHIVGVADRDGKGVIYLDGSTCTSGVDISGLFNIDLAGTDAMIIGGWLNSYSFNGTIDDVLIFNRTLSAVEVKVLYNSSLNEYYNNFTSLSEGEHKFTGYAVDLAGNLNETEERSVNVSGNSAPTISLVSPSDGNLTTDRTPTFTYSGSDDQSDSLVYDINITGVGFSADNRLIEDYVGESYTPTTDLKYLFDNGYHYIWSVRVCENATTELFCSEWATAWAINISASVQISLPNSFVNFGTMRIGDKLNTTNESLNSLSIRNDGNCKINVSMNATQLWDSIAYSPSDYFMAKIGAYSTNASWANDTWFQLPPVTGLITTVDRLNYTDTVDSLTFDILLEVPLEEPLGNKSAEINLRASLAE